VRVLGRLSPAGAAVVGVEVPVTVRVTTFVVMMTLVMLLSTQNSWCLNRSRAELLLYYASFYIATE
jgi:hypothetical protein